VTAIEHRRPTPDWSGEWHPLAERFPMLTEDELREMAASIAERGQYVPCRMSSDGLGLDGRNRVAACALAEVEPIWEVYDGDAVAFIIGLPHGRGRAGEPMTTLDPRCYPRCSYCGEPVNPLNRFTYRRIVAWERKAPTHSSRRGGSDAVLREQLDEWAHPHCVSLAADGIAPGQTSLV
jgi:hypothetical protein